MDALLNAVMRPLVRLQMDGKVPLAKAMGVKLLNMGNGVASSTMAAKPELMDEQGHVHPCAVFTLAETCSGGAMAGGFASVILKVRPVAAQVDFETVAPAQGRCIARSRIDGDVPALKQQLRKAGKVFFPVLVDVTDEQGRDVASMRVLWNLKLN